MENSEKLVKREAELEEQVQEQLKEKSKYVTWEWFFPQFKALCDISRLNYSETRIFMIVSVSLSAIAILISLLK